MASIRAIDVGAETIKAVHLERSGDNFVLKRWILAPVGDAARLPDGPEKRKLIGRRLAEALRAGRLLASSAVSLIPGRAGAIRYTRMPPVPSWRLAMMVEFEAKEQLAKGASCAFDHRILELPYSPGQIVVLIGAAQEQAARETLDLLKSAGVEDAELDLSTTAVFNSYRFLHGIEDDKTTLFADIGAEETHIVIERNGRLFFARTLTSGGRRFTQAVSQATGLDLPQAEDLKLKEGEVAAVSEEAAAEGGGGQTPAQKANLALLREASALAASLEASIMYAKTQTGLKDLAIDRLVLAGGGAELKGLLEFLARRLKVAKAERFEPARRLVVKGSAPAPEDFRRLAAPLGAAISRIHPTAFALDLLTDDLKRRREFFRHDIYLYYAAAVLIVALGMFVFRQVRDYFDLKAGLETRRAILKSDALKLDNYERLKEETEWLKADLDALLERVYSGRDILRVLSVFRKKTPPEIRLVEVAVNPPKVLDKAGFPPAGSFQENRRLFVRGWAESKVSDSAAVASITRFAADLKEAARDLFHNIEPVYISFELVKKDDVFLKEFVLLLELGGASSDLGSVRTNGRSSPGRTDACELANGGTGDCRRTESLVPNSCSPSCSSPALWAIARGEVGG